MEKSTLQLHGKQLKHEVRKGNHVFFYWSPIQEISVHSAAVTRLANMAKKKKIDIPVGKNAHQVKSRLQPKGMENIKATASWSDLEHEVRKGRSKVSIIDRTIHIFFWERKKGWSAWPPIGRKDNEKEVYEVKESHSTKCSQLAMFHPGDYGPNARYLWCSL